MDALQGPAHAKGHPISRADEEAGADDVDHAHTQYAHKPQLGTCVDALKGPYYTSPSVSVISHYKPFENRLFPVF